MKQKKISKTLLAGLLMGLVLVVLAVFAPLLSPYDPLAQDLYSFLKPPGAAHPFGTDQLGRDLLSRMLYAARTDLTVMLLAEVGPFILGTAVGMISGYYAGIADSVIGLLCDTFVAFPFYLLVIVIAFVTGAGIHGIFITYLLVGWVPYCKIARTMTLDMRQQPWALAAKMRGYSTARILLTEFLPNLLPQSIVVLFNDMVGLLVMIVTLGYLSIGISAPTPDWGTMISEGQTYIRTSWWLCTLPGLAVIYTGITLSFIGDGLADLWRQHGI